MPQFIFIQNLDKRLTSPLRITFCDSFLCRLRGLMFRSGLGPDEGLVLVVPHDSRADSSIHMFFVGFNLAVFWINSNFEIVDKVIARSWRPAYFPAKAARYTLELHVDHMDDFEIGQRVQFKDA
jgi:uncharacterized membrane protein (UPF0127 family)